MTSRRRFGTCVIAPKTSSERIVILLVHTRSILFRGLVCPDSAYCTRNAIIERHIESPNLIELQGLLGRGISSCLTVIRTVCRQFGNGSKFGASTKKSDGNPGRPRLLRNSMLGTSSSLVHSQVPTTQELVLAPSCTVRIFGFTSRWIGFVNTGRPIGSNPIGWTKASGQLLIKYR